MKKLLLVAVLALALAPGAGAKEITGLEVCGADGCLAVSVPGGLHEWPGGTAGGATFPPPAAPFVEIRLQIDRFHTDELWYVPSQRIFASRSAGDLIRWSLAGTQRIDQIVVRQAGRVEPFTPRAVAASIDGEKVAGDVSGYLDLFAASGPAKPAGNMVHVSVKTDPPSPWALTNVWFYPEDGVLRLGNVVVDLPAWVAEDLRAGRPISSEGRSFDWPLVSGALLLALALGLTALLLARRSRRPRAATA